MLLPLARRSARPRRLSPQAGINLIELVIVLGVFSVIMAAIWFIAAQVFENVKQHQTTQQLAQIVQNSRALFMRFNQFDPAAGFSAGYDMTPGLDKQEAFPKEMRANQSLAEGKLSHVWKTNTSAGNVKVTVASASAFTITYSQLPQKACKNLASRLSGGEIQGLDAVIVNGTSNTGATLPLTIVATDTQCTDTSGNNSVGWTYSLR